jgi:hypothetical protein
MNPVIPAPVPVPLPAPVWLLEILLVFTFILHLVPMNLLLGGGILVAISSRLGNTDPRHRDLARRCSRVLPAVNAFTITLGIAPLLFVQLMYGQLFYTSSVLMAWSWLGVVLLILLGYYGVYWFSMQQEELGTRAFWVMAVAAVLFLHVSLIFTQNMTFMLRPQEFYSVFLSRGTGSYLGTFDGATLARWLHFVVAAVATSGLAIALGSRYWRKENARAAEWADWARSYGTKWFIAGTGVQFAVGFGFLFLLPERIHGLFLGGSSVATAMLVAAVLLAIVALVIARKSLLIATLSITGTVALMAVMRHIVRIAYLEPYFDPQSLPVSGQWVVFVLFALLLVAGLLTVSWMLVRFFRPASASVPGD